MRIAKPSPALVISLLALVFAMTGTGIAAKSLITGKQIRNGTIGPSDLSKSVRAQLRRSGTAGPAGAIGATGPKGEQGIPGTARAFGRIVIVPGPDFAPAIDATADHRGIVSVSAIPTTETCLHLDPSIDAKSAILFAQQPSEGIQFATKQSTTFAVEAGSPDPACTAANGITISTGDFSADQNGGFVVTYRGAFEFLVP